MESSNLRSLYIDIIAGISGDMFLSALLSLNPLYKDLSEIISDLLETKISLTEDKSMVNSICASRLNIHMGNTINSHATFKSIKQLITKSRLQEKIKKDSIDIFSIIANAESRIHSQNINEVHFHEVGAIDSIIDIVGTSYMVNMLNLKNIFSSPAKIGCGMIKTAHGIIPVPAPAALNILEGVPVKREKIFEELTTPTGAAILKHFCNSFTYKLNGNIISSVFSTGTKIFDEIPNLLRLILFDESKEKKDAIISDGVIEIDCNIDDMSGENLGHIMNRLVEEKAIDTFFTPIFTKKQRPAYKITILTQEKNIKKFAEILLSETTTGGLRFNKKDRITLNSNSFLIKYKDNDVRIKRFYSEKIEKLSPEWDDVVKISNLEKTPAYKVFEEILKLLDSDKITKKTLAR